MHTVQNCRKTRSRQTLFFSEVRKLQIRVPLSQICKFLMCVSPQITNPRICIRNSVQLFLKTFPSFSVLKCNHFDVSEIEIFGRICKEKKYVFADLRKFKVYKSQKDWARKSQIGKFAHLRKVHKYNKLLKSANLRTSNLYWKHIMAKLLYCEWK